MRQILKDIVKLKFLRKLLERKEFSLKVEISDLERNLGRGYFSKEVAERLLNTRIPTLKRELKKIEKLKKYVGIGGC